MSTNVFNPADKRHYSSRWQLYRGKQLFKIIDERSVNGSEQLLSVSHITGITPRSQKNVTMFKSESLIGYKLCQIGDIAANTMWTWQGAIGVSKYAGVVSPSYNVYRQRGNLYNPAYLDFLLREPHLVDVYHSLSTGIRPSRLRLYPDVFLTISFPIPPRAEQDQIVRFLDWKISEINKLIGIRRKEILELEELKKIRISQELKGENVWLKRILKKKLQYGAISSGIDYDEDLPRYIRITDIDSNGCLKDCGIRSIDKKEAAPYLLKDNDILLARSGATVGKAFLYKKAYGKAAFAGYLIRASLDETRIVPEYFIYFTNSSTYENWKNSIFIKATIQNISAEKYGCLPIPLPTLKDQISIVNKLDTICTQINKFKNIKYTEVSRLQELKSSIISDVVTGKIDVRNIPIPEYEHGDDTDVDTSDDTEREAEERGE